MLSYDDIGQMFRLYFDIRPPYHVPPYSWMDLAYISINPP